MVKKRLKLREGEKIVTIVRQSFWNWFWELVGAGFLILAAFFLIYPLFRFGWPGALGFGLLLAAGLVWLLRICSSRYFSGLILTSRRVLNLKQRGLFNFSLTEVFYDRIAGVSWRSRGIFSRLAGRGDLIVNYGENSVQKLILSGIRRPQETVETITALRENFINSRFERSAGEARALIGKIKEKLGPKKFQKLIK